MCLSETEREFVEEYVEQLGKPNQEVIRANIERNRDEFDQEPDRAEIIGLVINEIHPEAEADWPTI